MRPMLFFLMLLLGIAAFAPASDVYAANAPAVIRIGEVATGGLGKPTGSSLASIAKEKGFFDQEFGKDKIKVDVIYFPGAGTAITESLATGAIDFGTAGGICNIIGLSGRIPARIVSVHHAMTRLYLAVRTDSPFRKVEDLRHRKVVGQRGTNGDVLLSGILAAHGLGEKDIVHINLDSAMAIPAFKAGAVDAIISGPNLLVLRDKGQVRILGDSSEVRDPEGNLAGTLVTNRFETAYPQLTERVVKVLAKAAWWASQPQNREAVIDFQARTGVPRHYYEPEFAGDLRPRYSPLIDGASRDSYRKLVGFATDHQLIQGKRLINFDNWFEPKYLNQALHELNLTSFWTAQDVAPQKITSR